MPYAILVVLAIGYRLWVSFCSLQSLQFYKKWQQQSQKSSHVALTEPYIFLFPVYKEQAIIEATLKHYEQFLQPSNNIRLVFVTTAKETGPERTYDLIARYQAKSGYSSRMALMECPITDGTKASQINYGLTHIREQHNTKHRIVCFDCDARISWQDFLAAEEWITNHPGAMIYSFVPRSTLPSLSFVTQSLIIHHHERLLAFEYAKAGNYPMGATMIVMPELWQLVSRIPEPIDDLPLAYLLRFYQKRCQSMPLFTNVQAPPDIKNIFRQIVPIFTGVFSYFSTAKRYQISLSGKQKLQGVLLYIFFLLEPLAIVLALQGNLSIMALILLQVALDLSWIGKWSLRLFIAHLWGYIIRLGQFGYFFYRVLTGNIKLSQFKTERRGR